VSEQLSMVTARRQAQRDDERRADRPAVRDRDDVVARVGAVHPRNGGTDPLDDVDEAFAVRRPLVRGRVPEGVRLLLPAQEKVAAV
jgi:hypothetical protein